MQNPDVYLGSLKFKSMHKSLRDALPQITDDDYLEDLLSRFYNSSLATQGNGKVPQLKDSETAIQQILVQALWYLIKGFQVIEKADLSITSPYSFCGANLYSLTKYHIQAFQLLQQMYHEVPIHCVSQAFFENNRLLIPTSLTLAEKFGASKTSSHHDSPSGSNPATTDPTDSHLLSDIKVLENTDALTQYHATYSKQKRLLLCYPPPPPESLANVHHPPDSSFHTISINRARLHVKVILSLPKDYGADYPAPELFLDTVLSGVCPYCYHPLLPRFRKFETQPPFFNDWICIKQETHPDKPAFGYRVVS